MQKKIEAEESLKQYVSLVSVLCMGRIWTRHGSGRGGGGGGGGDDVPIVGHDVL